MNDNTVGEKIRVEVEMHIGDPIEMLYRFPDDIENKVMGNIQVKLEGVFKMRPYWNGKKVTWESANNPF